MNIYVPLKDFALTQTTAAKRRTTSRAISATEKKKTEYYSLKE